MKTVKRIFLGILILIALAIIVGYFVLNHLRSAAIPDYNKSVTIPGLKEKAVILRKSQYISCLPFQPFINKKFASCIMLSASLKEGSVKTLQALFLF